MKKIMFNDKYGLTKAVLDEKKTQTRRICKNQDNPTIEESRYKVGDIIAVAQRYSEIPDMPFDREYDVNNKGWDNKMFVEAIYMSHEIKITNIRIERLQDISEADCLAEGVFALTPNYFVVEGIYEYYAKCKRMIKIFSSAKDAYAALIDKVSGKDTWNSNPFVYVYEFELVK